jgi:hypothetical protein
MKTELLGGKIRGKIEFLEGEKEKYSIFWLHILESNQSR